MSTLKKIVFINLRQHEEGAQYICWLPLFELFVCKAIEGMGKCNTLKVHTIFTHEAVSDHYGELSDADVVVCWDTYARSHFYVDRYFSLAARIKEDLGIPVLFGGYFPTLYGEYLSEFRVFDGLIRGYSVDGTAWAIVARSGDQFILDGTGESGYNKYPLDMSYLTTPASRYVCYDTIQGYFSSFGCPQRCKFCINDLYIKLGARFSPRSSEQVIADIEEMSRHASFSNVAIKDSNFFYDAKRCRDISKHVHSMGKSIYSNLDITVRDASEELFNSLAELNPSKYLFFGLESMVPEERRYFGKFFSDEQLRSFCESAERRGYIYSGNLMVGFPFQTPESIRMEVREAVSLMRRFPHLRISIGCYIPKIGTALQEEFFADVGSDMTLEELQKVYSSRVDDIQEKIYGEQFRSLRFERLKKGFEFLLSVKEMREAIPPFLQPVYSLLQWLTEAYLVYGAKTPVVSGLLLRMNVVRFKRRTLAFSTGFRRLCRRLSGAGTR